jgi:glycosyltransferase involved in cell wall biosynthesis
MACGTPVIISDRVNLHHAVTRHNAGLVVPHDLDSTVGALNAFAAMTAEQRQAMSAAAIDCYRSNFQIEAAATRVLDTIASYVDPQQRSTADLVQAL